VTVKFLADSLSAGAYRGRPLIDRTGLSGTFDFILEYAPEITGPAPPGTVSEPDTSGPSLEEALRDQLGIKWESAKSSLDVLVVDHLEHLSEN
jgi:uncharacterized protein (TIGR03435 family)